MGTDIKKMKRLRPPYKTPGGKGYLAPWIVSLFPAGYEQYEYVEVFCGGGSVYLQKRPTRGEVLNDLDVGVVQILRALRDEPGYFLSKLQGISYCQEAFERAVAASAHPFADYVDHAVNEFVLRRMSRGGMRQAFAWSSRLRGGQPGDVNAWQTILRMLPAISDRMRGVHIFNRAAVDVLSAFDAENVLAYADPPYLHESRTSKDLYTHEMNTDDHIRLAEELRRFRGKALISGYHSVLYDRLYAGWRCAEKTIANHASQQKVKQKRTEVVWMNY